jgi:RNA-directed DNA polymerase
MGTRSPKDVSTRLQRIAELARTAPQMTFTSLNHHIDIELLLEAYRRTRKDGAVGVDGQTVTEYAEHLEGNLQRLLDRFKSGTYKAPPVRRSHIPKGDGKATRPIGIPTFEDKVLQRAVVMVLEAIYEQDFLKCSYGFRPGRSAHQALEVLWKELMDVHGGYLWDMDIRAFFDVMDHGHLRSFLDRRVRDGVLRRMIDKWLRAGVLEEGAIQHPETGTPQGGVISPLLANIYLHEVLDLWFEEDIRPRMGGHASLIRFADDAVLVFALESDARHVGSVLPKRFAKYGLTLHPEKTRLVRFRRPPSEQGGGGGGKRPRPETFDFLGFTHYWGRSRRGRWVVKQRTAKNRLRRSVRKIYQWCREHRHRKVEWQHEMLVRKIRGHYAYYGITSNGQQLVRYRHAVNLTWKRWLSRRSQKARLTWPQFVRLEKRYPLPTARVVHSIYCRAANP